MQSNLGPLSFVVNGHKVKYVDGMAEFSHYGVSVRCTPEEFTYDWVLKMEYKLSVLKSMK